MEVMEGAPNKSEQIRYKAILDRFDIIDNTPSDQRWAMEQLERFHFSHHLRHDDCLIAAVAHRLDVLLYTHNLKDMQPLIRVRAVRPY
jgi:predicted nucleic acid-binding protein